MIMCGHFPVPKKVLIVGIKYKPFSSFCILYVPQNYISVNESTTLQINFYFNSLLVDDIYFRINLR